MTSMVTETIVFNFRNFLMEKSRS